MGIPISREVSHVFASGRDLAFRFERPFDSSYLLLALFAVPNKAVTLVQDRGVDEDAILASMSRLKDVREPGGVVTDVRTRMQQIAHGCHADLVSSLHLLMALSRHSHAKAYRVLQQAGLDPADLRRSSLAQITQLPARRLSPPATPRSGHTDTRVASAAPAPAFPEFDPTDPSADDSAPRPAGVQAHVEPAAARSSAMSSQSPLRDDSAPMDVDSEATDPTTPFTLDSDLFPALCQFGRNLTEEAWLERLDPLVGRERELDVMLDILQKRRSNNPCLIGEPGVGKTAIAEGLARVLAGIDPGWEGMEPRTLVELNVGSLLAGTQLRGAFAERLEAIKNEVKTAQGEIIVFIDELHTIIGAGAGDGPLDAANDLKAALARGEFPCVGATTMREYKRYVESDPALERRFQVVIVPEPSYEDALRIVQGVAPRYEEHHGVKVLPEAIEAAIRLSMRYVTDRCLPDKAINLIDLASSRARRMRRPRVDEAQVADVVSRQTQIPLEKLLVAEAQRMLALEAHLCRRVLGQADSLGRLAAVIRRNFAGFNSHRPMGSFLFVGPTGVGKTETVRALAEFLFESRDAIIRFDMSEFSERHAVSKLIGAPPGYVGHEDGGQLSAALNKRPYQIVLFDEIEKAHPEVWNLLLQVLDEGKLTDGRGQVVSFSNTVVILTSNLGADAFGGSSDRSIGFSAGDGAAAEADDRVLGATRRALPPELWNRIDEKLVYRPLERDSVRAIAQMLMADSSARLERERGVRFVATDGVVEHLIAVGGFDARLGARPMRQTVQRLIETAVATEILAGRADTGATVWIEFAQGALKLSVTSAPPPDAPPVEPEGPSESEPGALHAGPFIDRAPPPLPDEME